MLFMRKVRIHRQSQRGSSRRSTKSVEDTPPDDSPGVENQGYNHTPEPHPELVKQSSVHQEPHASGSNSTKTITNKKMGSKSRRHARISLILLLLLAIIVIILAIALAAVVDQLNERNIDYERNRNTCYDYEDTYEKNPEISLQHGAIMGKTSKLESGFEYLSYLGLPYARLTQGWGKPVYSTFSWNDTRNASTAPPTCWKHTATPSDQHTSDCLTLNVFLPRLTRLEYPPVLVIFSDEAYKLPDIGVLLEEAGDLVVVTLNYRVGVWGFLYTGVSSVSNYGYWDQQVALQWIHDNIRDFGGDPDKVTLLGYGQGGSNVKHLALYEDNRGLFRRVVDINGGSYQNLMMSCRGKKRARDQAQAVAASVGCPIYRTQEMLDCLRTVDDQRLATAGQGLGWTAVIDTDFIKDVPYIEYESGMTWGIDMLNIVSEEDQTTCTNDTDTPDIPVVDGQQFDSMVEYWHWYLTDKYGDSNAVIDQIFPLYNMTTNSKICDPEAVTFRRQSNHVIGQELDSLYHAKFASMWGNYHIVYDRTEGKNLWQSLGLIKKGGENDTGLDHPQESIVTTQLWRYIINFVTTGNPNDGVKVTTRVPKYDASHQESLYVSEGPHSWETRRSTYANVASMWESINNVQQRIDKANKCLQPSCVKKLLEVDTTSGKIRGVKQTINLGVDRLLSGGGRGEVLTLDAYLGVPYARFNGRYRKASYPHRAWPGTRQTNRANVVCHQNRDSYPGMSNISQNEDCLQLYIYTPEGAACSRNKRYPVLIHVDASLFQQQGAAFPGKELLGIVHDVVLVSIDYRQGAFGFLTARNNSVIPGNLGYWDQHLAIRWVRDNIKQFGGNPEKLILWGYSVGGPSVAIQPFFWGNRGRIKRVMVHGGGAVGFNSGNPSCCDQQKQLKNMEDLARSLNCNRRELEETVACLRSYNNPTRLQEEANKIQQNSGGFHPIIDGEFIEDLPYTMFQRGYYRGVDYMGGSDDFAVLAELQDWRDSCRCTQPESFWRQELRDKGLEASKLQGVYSNFSTSINPQSELSTRIGKMSSAAGEHFTDVKYHQTFTQNKAYNYMIEKLGATRGGYNKAAVLMFGYALKSPGDFGLNTQDLLVSIEMIKHQFNFAKTGNPNVGSPTQIKYEESTLSNIKTMIYQSNIVVSRSKQYLMSGELDFWGKYYWKTDQINYKTHCRGTC